MPFYYTRKRKDKSQNKLTPEETNDQKKNSQEAKQKKKKSKGRFIEIMERSKNPFALIEENEYKITDMKASTPHSRTKKHKKTLEELE